MKGKPLGKEMEGTHGGIHGWQTQEGTPWNGFISGDPRAQLEGLYRGRFMEGTA